MSRPINTTTHQQQYGAEPINVIEVQWVEDGRRIAYADRDIPAENILGRITLLDDLDFIINVSQDSDSQEITIGLSDVDGDLKNIMDTTDIHKKNVWIYQWFEDDSFSDKFLIFQGEINSPITWNERDRTLKFSVVSKIEDAEIGFSIEEGQFPNPPEELIGKPWPLKFGTTINVPALALSTPREGTLSGGIGIRDFNLGLKLDAARSIVCPLVFRGYQARYAGLDGISIIITPVFLPEEGCVLEKCRRIEELETKITEQSQYQFSKISVIGGDNFPQDTQITLNIGGGKFTGQFIGTTENPSNIFEVVSSEHPKLAELGLATEQGVKDSIQEEKDKFINSNCASVPEDDLNVQPDPSVLFAEESARSIEYFNAIPCPGFFWADAGSKVTIDSGEPTIYISNLLPETVHSVSAFRNLPSGQRVLLTIPESFYTTRSTNYSSYQVSEIVFPTPLSRIDAEWEDNIFVISTSTVGPNTVDIIEWLINKYTNLSIDTTSFDATKILIENYPSDFPILDRRNVLDVLKDIAFQARCAIYVRDRKFFLKYLPKQSSFDDTITESDVDENTLEIFHTDTEELVTKLIANWKRDYSKDDDNKIILRHNIKKYGTHEDTFDFFIYNELDYVHKSATFWLIRLSNTWRNLRLKTPLQKLVLETFDSVGITIPDLADGEVCGIVTKASYNSNNQEIDFEIWTPVRSGTRTKYDFAFPADIDQTLIWPTEEDRDLNLVGSGDAPGFSVIAPAGHPLDTATGLIQGFQFGPCASQGLTIASFTNQTCGGGNGDTYPADQGDSKKDKQLESDIPARAETVDVGSVNSGGGDRSTFGGRDQSTVDQDRLNTMESQIARTAVIASNANEAAGGDGSSAPPANPSDVLDQLPGEDDLPEGTCKHQVLVFVNQATAVNPSPVGDPINSIPIRRDLFTFNSRGAAESFAQGINQISFTAPGPLSVSVGEEFVLSLQFQPDTRPECQPEPEDPQQIAFDQKNPDGSDVEEFKAPEYIDE